MDVVKLQDNKSRFKSKAQDNDENTAFAVDLKYEPKNFRACSLCAGNRSGNIAVDHPTFKCSVYKTAQQKIERLKALKACLKCSYSNHGTADCKFKFKQKCRTCNVNHFSFLCPNEKSKNNSHLVDAQAALKCNFVWNGKITSRSNKFNALPTFSASIEGESFRCMYDTGCQGNFIAEDLIRNHVLEVVHRGINLTINGFNSSKNCVTNIVRVPFCVGSKVQFIEAVVVPKIDLDLKLPNLGKLVSNLELLQVNLADKFLDSRSKAISNVKFVLGSDAAHVLPIKTDIIGESNPSAILRTNIGMMLQGNIERLIQNFSSFNTKHEVTFDCESNNNESVANYDLVQNFQIIVENDDISEEILNAAAEKILSDKFYGPSESEFESVELNEELVQYCLDNVKILPNGRIQLPLLWKPKVSQMLGSNFNLAKNILMSNLKRLKNIKNGLEMTDKVIKDQAN